MNDLPRITRKPFNKEEFIKAAKAVQQSMTWKQKNDWYNLSIEEKIELLGEVVDGLSGVGL